MFKVGVIDWAQGIDLSVSLYCVYSCILGKKVRVLAGTVTAYYKDLFSSKRIIDAYDSLSRLSHSN